MTDTEHRELTAVTLPFDDGLVLELNGDELDLVSGGFAFSALDAAGKDPLVVASNALVFSGDAYDNEMG